MSKPRFFYVAHLERWFSTPCKICGVGECGGLLGRVIQRYLARHKH